ncbi:MAG: type II toxin-antitoxin system HicB family antitoxin [Armatimonadetes bacterium]|nr:type II toxin-antitoxin system HicB family antitoxin [Armatimonadota bacterium]
MELKVVVKKGKSGHYVARVPALKGCWSQGATVEEAIANIKEAAALWLEVEQEKRARGVGEKSETFAVQL